MLSQILDPLINLLHQLSGMVPLPVFTFFGAFIEEVLAPIPSPLVMTLAGSMTASLGKAWTYLLFLALVGSIGKTIGSYIIYVISDKGEDLILTRFGKYLGVPHKAVAPSDQNFFTCPKFWIQLSFIFTHTFILHKLL
jgi:membrane protein DedA with SNARE-associated domain